MVDFYRQGKQLRILKTKIMSTINHDAQFEALTNFAKSLDLNIKTVYFEDKRKSFKFVICKDKLSISSPLNYSEANIFMLGIYNAKKHNL